VAHLIGAENVRVLAGPRVLFEGVSLGLEDGAAIGVVGRNGAGKSTLLRLLAGRQDPDGGRVTRAGGTRVAVLDQSDALPPGRTVLDVVHGDLDVHVWASQAAIREIHDGLLADVDLEAEVSTLSGGQRRRAALAAVLTDPAEVLVLDEPTNHLDVEGVDWLARHLLARFAGGKGALVVVTHDRWFLDAVCTRIWEVVEAPEGGSVQVYDGSYAAYVLARAERSRMAAADKDKRANLLRKELAWLRRGAPARTSKPRFRLDAAAALIADEPPPRDTLELTKLATARLGKQVVDLEDVSLEFTGPEGEVRRILDDVTWRLAPGARIGVVGVNGAGKTTVLRLLQGTLEPTAGKVRRGKTVRAATLSQEVRELDVIADLRVLEAVEQVRARVTVGDKELTATQLVERLGFTRERAWTRVGDLSGGERRRLQLLRLLVGEPNLLLLDEPTNDLDTDTLAAVEDLLDGWPGTLVVVSHDRYLLERVTETQVALLGDGRIRDLPGGVEQYLELRRGGARSAGSAPAGSGGATGAGPGVGAAGDGAERGQGAAPPEPARDAGAARAARKEIARLERQLDKLRQQEAGLHAELAAAATDHQAAAGLAARLREVEERIGTLEDEWLEAAEAAE
jgi:ATPase subunit of ABC transporter with duplicated ATPase domains